MRPLIPSLDWATDPNYAAGPDVGTPTKVSPTAGQRASGYVPDSGLAAQIQNDLLSANGRLGTYYQDIDWLNMHSVKVNDFSNDDLGGAMTSLAYRVLPFNARNDLDGYRWQGCKNGGADPGCKSEDGVKWFKEEQTTSGGNTNHPKSIIYSPTLNVWVVGYVAGGDEIGTSFDGDTWTIQNDPAAASARNAIVDNGSIVVICRQVGGFVTATTEAIWTERTHPATNKFIHGIAWSPSLTLFAAVGNAGTIVTSPDGLTWLDRTVGAAAATGGFRLTDIAWDPVSALFCAGGFDGRIVTSPDGINWTDRTQSTFDDSADTIKCIVADGNGTLFLTGITDPGFVSGVVGRSLDGGVTWEFVHNNQLDNLAGCVIGDGRLVLFGTGPENDGVTGFGLSLGLRTSIT